MFIEHDYAKFIIYQTNKPRLVMTPTLKVISRQDRLLIVEPSFPVEAIYQIWIEPLSSDSTKVSIRIEESVKDVITPVTIICRRQEDVIRERILDYVSRRHGVQLL